MKHISKSLQLISYNQSKLKFQLNEKALLFLENLDKPLAITTISGSICSGKSYLLNQIVGNQDFIVNSKSVPQTKGIWISKTPLLSLDESYYNIFLDGEGLSSIDKDSDYDIKLLLIEIMISSTFIYNSFGAIQQSSLQNIRSSVGLKKYCGEWNKFQFADLIWVARDFNLGLIDRNGYKMSQIDYFQSVLKQIQNNKIDDYQSKNQTRKILRQTFINKYCYTLSRPTINQSVLRNLSANHNKIKPQFLSKIAQLRKDIIFRSKPKQLNNTPISCSKFSYLLRSLVDNVNNIGQISTSNWNTISCYTNQKVYQDCLIKFYSKLQAIKLSLPRSGLQKTLQQLSKQIQKQYNTKCLSSSSNTPDSLKISKLIQKHVNQLIQLNIQLQKQQQCEQFNKMYNNLDLTSKLQKPSLLKQSLNYLSSRLNNKQQYFQYSQRLIQLILVSSVKLSNINIDLANNQISQLKQDYNILKQINNDANSNIRLLEQRIIMMDGNISSLQIQKNTLIKQLAESTQSINKQNIQLSKLKQQNISLQSNIKQYEFKIKQLQGEVTNHQQQIQSHVKIFLQQKNMNQQQNKFYQNQIKQLKQTIQIIKNNHQRSNIGLLENNQILRKLEYIKNRDYEIKQKQVIRDREKLNKQYQYVDEKRLRQEKNQIILLENKIKKLQMTIIELSDKIRKQQQSNRDIRYELDEQLNINKQINDKSNQYEQMIISLENSLQVIQASQQKQKRLYEQSVLRLISNVQKRQQQYKRKGEMKQKYSRYQY